MDTINIKCPGCGSALSYAIGSKDLACVYCGMHFNAEDVLAQENSTQDENDLMECQIFSCSSCGAEISVQPSETATFCAYCGQPTLVANRITRQRKPELIIPFSVDKNRAEEIVRKRLSKGLFVPKSVKNFKFEALHGVYIPYKLIDIECQDEQILSGTKSEKSNKILYFYRKAKCLFKNITIDGSVMLNNSASTRLEPYDMKELVPFKIPYLSGFYSNCIDDSNSNIEALAQNRTRDMFSQKMIESVKAKNVMIARSKPEMTIVNSRYALLPAWFLSFVENGTCYTIMVNGQTGKCIGGLPIVKNRVIAAFAFLSIVSIPVMIALMVFLMSILDDEGIYLCLSMILGLFFLGQSKFHSVKKSQLLATERNMTQFANNRQEGQ